MTGSPSLGLEELSLLILFVNGQATNPSGAELHTSQPLQVTEDGSSRPKVLRFLWNASSAFP